MECLWARSPEANDPLPGQKKIDRLLEEHYVESGKKELIKSRIRERGEYAFLGQLTLSYDQRTDHYWADVPALGDIGILFEMCTMIAESGRRSDAGFR